MNVRDKRLRSDFGLEGTVGEWLRSYATGRSQHVKVGGASAGITFTETGVPRGSVLGPQLFSAYMSPIARIIDSYGIQQHHYADDTTLYVKVSGPSDVPPADLTLCINQVVRWCHANGMQINPDKTELLLVSPPSQLNNYDLAQNRVIAGTSVKICNAVKIVGVTLDSAISFDNHISNVCQSCNFYLRALRGIRPMLSIELANQLVVLSHLSWIIVILCYTTYLIMTLLDVRGCRIMSHILCVGPTLDLVIVRYCINCTGFPLSFALSVRLQT
jgi:Reverse transcriptase (RNA-dependent DNA polymerase)